MASIKSIAKSMLPPLFLETYRYLKRGKTNQFKGPLQYDQIAAEDVWSGDYWVNISKQKLQNIEKVPKRKYSYSDLTSLYINSLSREGRITRVLDWGGGTGFSWFQMHSSLQKPHLIEWCVVDSVLLGDIGRQYNMQYQTSINFFPSIDDAPHETYDVVHINTSVQYVENFETLFSELIKKKKPNHIILTRLLRSDGMNHATYQQDLGGVVTPCTFFSESAITDFMSKHDYEIVFNSPNWDDCHHLAPYLPPDSVNIIGMHSSKDIFFRRRP